MEVALHHHIARGYMAPPPHNSDSSFSTYALTTPRSSDSTANTSNSVLFNSPPSNNNHPPANYAPSITSVVTATNNVINRVADANASLFQICRTLKNKIEAIEEVSEDFLEVEEQLQEQEDDDLAEDPVHFLWTLFKRGTPLIDLFNAASPNQQITLNNKSSKKEKEAVFKFCKACIDILQFSGRDMFTLTDLFGKPNIPVSEDDKVLDVDLDSSGFVKVRWLLQTSFAACLTNHHVS